jgi:hypothetical protein
METYNVAIRQGLKDTEGRLVKIGDLIDITGYFYRTPSGAVELCAERTVTVSTVE